MAELEEGDVEASEVTRVGRGLWVREEVKAQQAQEEQKEILVLVEKTGCLASKETLAPQEAKDHLVKLDPKDYLDQWEQEDLSVLQENRERLDPMESRDLRVTLGFQAARELLALKVLWVHKARAVDLEQKEHKEERVSEERREVKDNLDRMDKRALQVIQAEAAEMEKMDHVDWMEQLVIRAQLDSKVHVVNLDHKGGLE